MWEDDACDFGGQTNGDSGDSGLDSAGALDLGQSELMYGTFMDPTVACSSVAWDGRFGLNQLQPPHHDNEYQQHGLQQFSAGLRSDDQDDAVRVAASIDNSAALHAVRVDDPSEESKVFWAQEAASATARASAAANAAAVADAAINCSRSMQQHCMLPSVPELTSWWGSGASTRQAVSRGGNGDERGVDGVDDSEASIGTHWTPGIANHQQQPQPPPSTEPVSEREFIIVRKAKTNGINWDGSPVTDSAVVYECRICGRQCRWRSSISVHVRTHTGRKPYQCRVCHHRFADSSTRKKHEKKTHGCVIPCNKKAAEIDGQMAATATSVLQQQSEPSPTCHLCFAMLPTQSELTKHLYEYHNHLTPTDFGAPLAGAADEVPLLVTPLRRPVARHSSEPSIFQQQELLGDGGCGHSVWPEFDDACNQNQQHSQMQHLQLQHRQQQHQQQRLVGIPLPAVSQSAAAREIDQNIGAVDQLPEHQQDGQDLLYPYEIGCLGRDLHGIESILDEGRLTSYNQHLEFDKLDW